MGSPEENKRKREKVKAKQRGKVVKVNVLPVGDSEFRKSWVRKHLPILASRIRRSADHLACNNCTDLFVNFVDSLKS